MVSNAWDSLRGKIELAAALQNMMFDARAWKKK
jgi:hypothetical protein